MAVSTALLSVLPLAMAAGIDLYLTLFLIGVVPATGLWETPLVGALDDLSALPVLVVVGALYAVEFAAERSRRAALAWNAFHAVIRPVSGALLALLVLDGQPFGVVAAGVVIGGAITSLTHGVRCGAFVLRWIQPTGAPSRLLFSLGEDAVVLGLVALTLDAPFWGTLLAVVVVLVGARHTPSTLRAFVFGTRVGAERVLRPLDHRRWRHADRFPSWLRAALLHGTEPISEALARGTPAAAGRLPGAPSFATGWLVVGTRGPMFACRRGPSAALIPLYDLTTPPTVDGQFFRRLELLGRGRGMFLLFGSDGPTTESLRSEFARG